VSAADLISRLEALEQEFQGLLRPLSEEQELRALQAKYLGKKGAVSLLMREMGKVPNEDKKAVGQAFNKAKTAIADAVDAKLQELEAAAARADLERVVDVTLPGRTQMRGHLHLISQVLRESVDIFAELGFAVAEGPQIEGDFYNFEALAMHKDHPARDEQDTFYVTDDVVLRTHTSPVQIRTMQAVNPPIKIIAPGQVYRRDDDPTHSPMFTQIEGLLVDERVRLSDLKGVLLHYVRRFFAMDLALRFRSSYFPFVEPGCEVDMECSFCRGKDESCRVCKGTGWVEIGGAGMVDPEVFQHCGVDSEAYTGFAFGMGIERMAMLRHGVNDIKYYYEGDLRFLEQF
jgi:phenylalanyl-tRNA synthetase alpha chain